MSETVVVHNGVYETAKQLSKDREITMKEAIRDVFKEAGYDV